jgi:hypothetical protein
MKWDWRPFRLLKILLFGVSTLISAITFRRGPSFSLRRVAVVDFVLIELTRVDATAGKPRALGCYRRLILP